MDSYIFTAVLADGLLTHEAPQVSAWVLVPACIAVGISAEVSPGVEQHWLLPGLDPVDGFCWKGNEVEI